MQIAVFGLGKLGCPLAAVLAEGGPVIGVDLDQDVVDAINDGRAPVDEPYLQDYINANRERLHATTDGQAAARESDVIFIVVPTPSLEDHRFSIEHVMRAGVAIGLAIKEDPRYRLIVLVSTVLQGDTACLALQIELVSKRRCGEEFGLCYGPEFIQLGNVIGGLQKPDYVLIGESDRRAGDQLEYIYRTRILRDLNTPFHRMSLVEAEITKISQNVYCCMKMSFANMVGELCEKVEGADAMTVVDAIGSDRRVGREFLTPAAAWGGPCFPRDCRAYEAMATSLGAPSGLAEAADLINREQASRLANKAPMPEGHVLVLGATYKTGTDVTEESAGTLLYEELRRRSVDVTLYDPTTDGADNGILTKLTQQADTIVLTTPWPEFKHIGAKDLKQGVYVIDCWRLLDEKEVAKAGGTYFTIGRGIK